MVLELFALFLYPFSVCWVGEDVSSFILDICNLCLSHFFFLDILLVFFNETDFGFTNFSLTFYSGFH